MSTVIWYKGIIYGDTQITRTILQLDGTEIIEIDKGEKIFKIDDKIYGITGTLEGWNDFISRKFKSIWYWDLQPFHYAIILEWDGKTMIQWKACFKKFLWFHFCRFIPTELTCSCDTVLTMGWDQDLAMSAMKMGLTPKESIQYVSDRCIGTNDDVMSVELDPHVKKG